MFVNHAKLLQDRFWKIKYAADQSRGSPDFEKSLLDYLKLTFSEAEQKYFVSFSTKQNWDLPVRNLKFHKVSKSQPGNTAFFKKLKAMAPPPPQNFRAESPFIKPVRYRKEALSTEKRPKKQLRKLDPEPSFIRSKFNPRIQQMFMQGRVANEESIQSWGKDTFVHRHFADDVLFVYQIGKQYKGSQQLYSPTDPFNCFNQAPERLGRIKNYDRRVRSMFRPGFDEEKRVNSNIREMSYRKYKSFKDIPKVKLFKF